jgi:signal transduction histidine kinase
MAINLLGQSTIMSYGAEMLRELRFLIRERIGPIFGRVIRFLTHPVSIFVILQLVCIAVTVLWVVWFVNQDQALSELAQTFGQQNIDRSFGLGLLVAGCILLGVLIVGLIVLFTNAQRQSRLNRQQQNFVSSVTHELRSPLASLQLAFDTIRTRSLEQEVKQKFFEMIDRDLSRLKKLVDQILLSAKLDRGMIDLQKLEEINLRDLVADAVSKASFLDTQLASRVKIEVDPSNTIFSTRDGLALILGNFIENAIKYSPRGSPIEVSVNCQGERCDFSVKDQGFGLVKGEKKRVFRMFHRANAATKHAIPGTGLGLYIVQSIVKSMGGKVWAESDGRDLGSKFCVSIPGRNLKEKK